MNVLVLCNSVQLLHANSKSLFLFFVSFSRYVLPVTCGSAHSSKSAKRQKRDDQASLVHACRVLIHKVRRPIIYGERYVTVLMREVRLLVMMMMMMTMITIMVMLMMMVV